MEPEELSTGPCSKAVTLPRASRHQGPRTCQVAMARVCTSLVLTVLGRRSEGLSVLGTQPAARSLGALSSQPRLGLGGRDPPAQVQMVRQEALGRGTLCLQTSACLRLTGKPG